MRAPNKPNVHRQDQESLPFLDESQPAPKATAYPRPNCRILPPLGTKRGQEPAEPHRPPPGVPSRNPPDSSGLASQDAAECKIPPDTWRQLLSVLRTFRRAIESAAPDIKERTIADRPPPSSSSGRDCDPSDELGDQDPHFPSPPGEAHP